MNEQQKHNEWHFQWDKYYDDSLFLFKEWIYPNKLEDFRGKDVVDCGCGGGQHINFIAPLAKSVVGIDLNTVDIARRNNRQHPNVSFIEGDLAKINVGRRFDIAYCIGVLQHTADPDKTFDNIKNLVKPGGRLIVWCYSKEGNWPNWLFLEPLKRLFILRLPKNLLNRIAFVMTAVFYPLVYTVYRLPLRFLPYYQYFENFRLLSFRRNMLNVFDKLNAPMTNFITRNQIEEWFNRGEFSGVYMDHYKGVSWRASGTKSAYI